MAIDWVIGLTVGVIFFLGFAVGRWTRSPYRLARQLRRDMRKLGEHQEDHDQ